MPRKKTNGTLAVSKKSTGRLIRLHKRFWGVDPQSILTVKTPGRGKKSVVSLGRSPAVHLANGPLGRASKERRIKHRGRMLVTSDSRGKRLIILNVKKGLPKKPKLKFMGWVPITEYIPSPEVERAGTFKARRHWWHEHKDKRGRWPRVWRDQNGNYYYGRSTYYIGRRGWLER